LDVTALLKLFINNSRGTNPKNEQSEEEKIQRKQKE